MAFLNQLFSTIPDSPAGKGDIVVCQETGNLAINGSLILVGDIIKGIHAVRGVQVVAAADGQLARIRRSAICPASIPRGAHTIDSQFTCTSFIEAKEPTRKKEFGGKEGLP